MILAIRKEPLLLSGGSQNLPAKAAQQKRFFISLVDAARYPDLIDRFLEVQDGKPLPSVEPSRYSSHWQKIRTLALRKDGKLMRSYGSGRSS